MMTRSVIFFFLFCLRWIAGFPIILPKGPLIQATTRMTTAVTRLERSRIETWVRYSQMSDNDGPIRQDDDDDQDEQYTAVARLREEAESPFRSFRFFIYGGIGASGAIGALTSLTGALAAYSGVRGAMPLSEAGVNVAIDFGAIVVAAVLWKLDSQGKSRRLDRLTLGAKIAALKVQLQDREDNPVFSLADFRRNRGNARRVVILAGNEQVVQNAINDALSLKDRLLASNFLVIPVVLEASGTTGKGNGRSAAATLGVAQERLQGALDEAHIGWPILLQEWQEYLATEVATARKQGIDPETQGISIVLKLNGRVGQRGFGSPPWSSLIGDVERRKKRGLDVTNI